MTCTQTQPHLDTYADSELSPLAAFCVRRHLTNCPACAAELADIRQLHRRVQAWHDAPVPASLGGRIAAALPPAAIMVPSPPRRRSVHRRVAIGLAGLTAATGAGLWLLPGHPSQPTIAFADVEQAMQQVQIVSWKSRAIVTDANWQPLHNQKSAGTDSTTWLRHNPPAIAMSVQPSGPVSLTDDRGTLEHTAQGNYVKFPHNSVTGMGLAKDIESQIKALTEKSVLTSPASTPNSHSKFTNFQQHSVLLGGQKRILFTFDGELVVHAIVFRSRKVFPTAHYFTHSSTWVDPATRLVTRIERWQWNNYDYTGRQFVQPNQRMIFITSDFRYNQTPPPGVFDWSPPPGTNVIDSCDLKVGKGLRLYLPKERLAK